MEFLKTLPRDTQWICEIIKAAIIKDSKFFGYLESNIDQIMNLKMDI